MPAEDLKSRVPGPLDDASRAFVDRVGSRGQRDLSTEEGDPGSEIDETSLPLEDSVDTPADDAVNDVEGERDDQPSSNNSNDEGEDETPAILP
jgi:hypothetical protein